MNIIKNLILSIVWFATSVIFCMGVVGWIVLQPLMLPGNLLSSLKSRVINTTKKNTGAPNELPRSNERTLQAVCAKEN